MNKGEAMKEDFGASRIVVTCDTTGANAAQEVAPIETAAIVADERESFMVIIWWCGGEWRMRCVSYSMLLTTRELW